jgi:DNA relaxase NicK
LSDCTIVDSGVDWLTMTAPQGAATESLGNTATQLARENDECGNIMTSWAQLGYVGWKVGPLAFGMREEASIVVCSGPDAQTVLRRCWKKDCHVTRLDLQVTVRVTNPPVPIATEAYRSVMIALDRRQIASTANLIVGSDGGSTCYVGARSSERFGRIYDKDVQSKDPDYRDCWRYELELKGGLADTSARALVGRHDWESWIYGAVRGFYSGRRIDTQYLPYGPIVSVPAKRPESDLDRVLRWLREQVAPSVNTLRLHGKEGAVMEALGLLKPPNGTDTFKPNENFGSHGGPK